MRTESMTCKFSIRQWSAFAPGLEQAQAWIDWARAPWLPCGEATPALAEMPAMQRRRVEKLGRMALQVAYWCQSAEQLGLPLVFASRHGDLSRTYAMLQELARGNSLSPTSFGLSTHNAIAAQYSIARSLPNNYLAVSAGACSAEAAVTEALGLLGDGAQEVLVINYDGCVPEDYREFSDEPECDFAWALRIAASTGEGDSPVYSLRTGGAVLRELTPLLPHGLDVLRFLLNGDSFLEYADPQVSWRWQRDA